MKQPTNPLFSVSQQEEKHIENSMRERYGHYEKYIREFASPPIKGEITKGKLRWRGIRIMVTHLPSGSVSWIAQRGRPISPVIPNILPPLTTNTNQQWKRVAQQTEPIFSVRNPW